MNTNTPENQIIGELLSEIIGKGWETIETDVNDAGQFRTVEISISNPEPGQDCFFASAGNMIEALESLVDSIRRFRGEPTLAEEVANMIAKQDEHAHALIHIQPGARCACGSPFLMVDKSPIYKMAVDLQTGEVCFTERPPAFTVENGELARCPSCNNWYRLTA